MKKIMQIIRAIRRQLLKYRLKNCGKNLICCTGVTICNAKYLDIGDDVRLGEEAYLNARGGIKIGNNVRLGAQVFILSFTSKNLSYEQKEILRPVTINDNVWIGAKSCIIPGITIGKDAIIERGSLVTQDVPPGTVVSGNPAKILKYCNTEVDNTLNAQ